MTDLLQLLIAGRMNNGQRGVAWNLGARDGEPPPVGKIAARMERARRNYMETFPFFAAAVLIAQAAGVHNELTHWGSIAYIAGRIAYTVLYISGIPLIRSLFWNIAAFGMLAVLAAPFVPR